jgi:hypothetical protein
LPPRSDWKLSRPNGPPGRSGAHWGDVLFAFRNRCHDMPGDRMIQNLRLTGPALGVTFRR